ncbi:MAG: HicB family protein [Synergistaceae bacterium]|nr:HicB family protein [Synergistaceae bacterium]
MAAKKDLRIYPALFHFEEEDKLFCVEYPDLPGCVTVGENMEIALRRAKEALEGFLYSSEQNGYPVAPPTPLEKMSVPAGHILVPVSVRMDILREEMANRSITKNVTIPAWLNKMAMEQKINFSSTLQEALRERLGV